MLWIPIKINNIEHPHNFCGELTKHVKRRKTTTTDDIIMRAKFQKKFQNEL